MEMTVYERYNINSYYVERVCVTHNMLLLFIMGLLIQCNEILFVVTMFGDPGIGPLQTCRKSIG